VAALRAVAQYVVHQDQGQHRLGDGRRADSDAGIVAAESFDDLRIAFLVDRAARDADAGSRLDRQRHGDVLAGRNSAEHAAGLVADKAFGSQFVTVLAALLRDATKTG